MQQAIVHMGTIFLHMSYLFQSLSGSIIPELFIANLKPASFDENISNLPILKISNMFTDQGPIPKTDNKVWLSLYYLNKTSL